MTTYYLKGEKYYYKNGRWLTEEYTVAPSSMVLELNKLLSEEKDFSDYDVEQLISEAKHARDTLNYQLAKKILETAVEKANLEKLKVILPMLTSTFRLLGNADEAINIANDYLKGFPEVASSALFTSVAAAYCDKEMYIDAKRYADRAFAYSSGKGTPELYSLYERLKNVSGSE